MRVSLSLSLSFASIVLARHLDRRRRRYCSYCLGFANKLGRTRRRKLAGKPVEKLGKLNKPGIRREKVRKIASSRERYS